MFGASIHLEKLGKNTIAATATNVAGNATTAAVVITYVRPRCKVPKLLGKTLKSARRLVKRAHCTIGKLKRVQSRKVRKGRIVATKPRARTTHRYGYKVRLMVSTGAPHRNKHHR